MREERGERDEEQTADGDLMARVGRGEEVAFLIVYDRYADGVFGASVRFVRDRELAAEIVQDTFLAAWTRAHQYDPAFGSLVGWLLGIARHRAIDRLRSESRRPISIRGRDGWMDQPDGILDTAARRLAGTDLDEPAAELDRRWLRAVMRTVLSELRTEEREVLVLAYDHGLSQSEIASRVGLPIGTVKSRTRRALAQLRATLESVPDLRETSPASAGTPTPSTGSWAPPPGPGR